MSESRVISFKLISPFHESKCEHAHILIDEELWNLECADCGASLDPIAYLVKLAKKEAVAQYNLDKLNELIAKAQGKMRTKCVHCGKFTPIRVGE